ncbi:hypothetical protein KUTeg_014815 [Tegillarca granosa]|uniref:Uncharacterized protein n=1 Tax=Tegillarca granosa TaxID=220873 RepID=A0ABQ9EQX4_TEGGR|nr:hypothetical protein KUTeg_014815 [Tegillarca granosa]
MEKNEKSSPWLACLSLITLLHTAAFVAVTVVQFVQIEEVYELDKTLADDIASIMDDKRFDHLDGKRVKGEKGDLGDRGETGAKGAKGDPGVRGYNGSNGDQGAIGPMGPKGQKGDRGPSGDIGPKGEPGVIGPMFKRTNQLRDEYNAENTRMLQLHKSCQKTKIQTGVILNILEQHCVNNTRLCVRGTLQFQ